jgi:hypothetical protein
VANLPSEYYRFRALKVSQALTLCAAGVETAALGAGAVGETVWHHRTMPHTLEGDRRRFWRPFMASITVLRIWRELCALMAPALETIDLRTVRTAR